MQSRVALVAALTLFGAGCTSHPVAAGTPVVLIESLDVALSKGELYVLPTVGGDEDGAWIRTQASHHATSQFRRDSSTNWVATYMYRPAEGYVGSDAVELEVQTGSDGASPPRVIRRLTLRFAIR